MRAEILRTLAALAFTVTADVPGAITAERTVAPSLPATGDSAGLLIHVTLLGQDGDAVWRLTVERGVRPGPFAVVWNCRPVGDAVDLFDGLRPLVITRVAGNPKGPSLAVPSWALGGCV